ncbi:MAG: tRNA pseudouridine(55) synthase TruB [Chitinophagales bacterium]
MNGFLNVSKPQSITSFDVIRRIRPLIPGVKIGHLGTLDPMAEGVLPLALGYATRLIEYISDDTKEYTAEMVLGGTSDTQDATGQITPYSGCVFDHHTIKDTMDLFRGEIEQVPPIYSAVHYQGRRLYEYARKGIEVAPISRKINIKKLDLLDLDCQEGLMKVTFQVECSAGTYVRTLCHDIGQKLGCGGYLNRLIRTRSGPFLLKDAIALDDINKDRIRQDLLKAEYPLGDLPHLKLNNDQTYCVVHGRAVDYVEAQPGQTYLLMGSEGNLLAIARGTINEDRPVLQPEKVLK